MGTIYSFDDIDSRPAAWGQHRYPCTMAQNVPKTHRSGDAVAQRRLTSIHGIPYGAVLQVVGQVRTGHSCLAGTAGALHSL